DLAEKPLRWSTAFYQRPPPQISSAYIRQCGSDYRAFPGPCARQPTYANTKTEEFFIKSFYEETRIRRKRKNDEANGRKSGGSDWRKQRHRFGNGKASSARRGDSSHLGSKQEDPG